MSIRDSEMHVVAMVGACVLTAALSIPTIIWASSTGKTEDESEDDKVKKFVVEASLAMKKETEVKQPQKDFKQPDQPDKPTGKVTDPDDDKVPKPQCCTNEADCNKVALAFPTTCPDDGLCVNNRCKPKKKKPSDDKEPVTRIPDRTGSVDDPKGNPTPNTLGAFDGSKKGTARINSGDPWLRELANDFITHVDFPALEEASAASACLRIEKEGTIKDTTLDPPAGRRSDNEGLNAKIEIAFKKITQERGQGKPEHAVPTRLLEKVVTGWTCIPIDAQTKQN